MKSIYKNYEHYIKEESKAVKKSFLLLNDKLSKINVDKNTSLLDIGCAAGELISYLYSQYPQASFTGIDVFDDLLKESKQNTPSANFKNISALVQVEKFNNSFDIITIFGVIGVFDDKGIEQLFENALSWLKPGGKCYIFEPFNNYGMDLIAQHRKRNNGIKGDWELGNSVYSIETIEELLVEKCQSYKFESFDIGMQLKKTADPQRTWTINCEDKKYQLTNGLKILFDMYLLEIVK